MIEFKDYQFYFIDYYESYDPHPVYDYFFMINDLSINLKINMKWLLWGFYFLNNIKNEIKYLNKNIWYKL